MTRYREIPRKPKEVEAMLYTGENVEEIKEFLGEYFVEVDETGRLWYRQSLKAEIITWLDPRDMIVRTIEKNFFYDEYEGDFLEKWKEVLE